MESATVSILVNGSPTEKFKPKRRLRQGDPLAPFLFIIVVEGLTGLMRKVKKANGHSKSAGRLATVCK